MLSLALALALGFSKKQKTKNKKKQKTKTNKKTKKQKQKQKKRALRPTYCSETCFLSLTTESISRAPAYYFNKMSEALAARYCFRASCFSIGRPQ